MESVRACIHAAAWTTQLDLKSVSYVLDRAATIGFDGVVIPLRDFDAIRPAEIGRAFEERGMIPLNAAGLSLDADVSSLDLDARQRGLNHLLKAVSLARDMGSRQISGVLYGALHKATEPASDARRSYSAECLAEVAEAAEAAGMRMALEIVNRYETNLINTIDEGLAFLDLIDHQNVFLHVDTFHMSIEESDPRAALLRALPRLGYFEFDQSHRGRLDQGSLDLVALGRPLAEAGYSGFVGVEAFARSRMGAEHANTLAIWRDLFDDGDALAENALQQISVTFGFKPDHGRP